MYKVTFAFYDKKGRRLSVFARFTDAETIEFFVLKCSLSDHFAKKISYDIYEKYLADGTITDCKPEIFTVPVTVPEQDLQDTLMDFCIGQYYSYVQVDVPLTVLVESKDIYLN